MGTVSSATTVVVATRDRRDSLLRTLACLERLPERPAVIVVDNGSTDGGPEAVAALHPAVDVVRLGRNAGGAARNVGVRRASTDVVAFADDDSWWAPGALARAAGILRGTPRLAAVAARILVGPEERLDPTCRLMARSPLGRAPGMPGPSVLGFLACGLVLRRDAFLAVGGFDERLGIGGEEELVALDLAVAGWEIAYVDAVVAHHHPSAARDPGRRTRVQERNAVWTAWLRRPARRALARTAALAGRGARDAACRQALFDALRGAPWVARARRRLPDHVEARVRRLEAAPLDRVEAAPAGPGDRPSVKEV